MSPPSFDMDKKAPEVTVTVETPAKSETKSDRLLRMRLVIGVVLVVLLVVIAMLVAIIVFKQFKHQDKEDFDTTSLVGGRKVPEHVKVDFQNEVIYVSNERDGDVDGLLALHAYSRGMLAFKDLTNNKCYIDRLNDTFQEGLQFWQSQEGKDRTLKMRYFRYIREPIDRDVLQVFGGELVAQHCQDVASHWIVPLPQQPGLEQQLAFLNKTAEFICRPSVRVVEAPERTVLALGTLKSL